MTDHDPDIVFSDLSHTVSSDGITVRVEIYRLASAPKWSLEVVNELQTSTVWDDLFDTEEEALRAFEEALAEEGIESFIGSGDAETLH